MKFLEDRNYIYVHNKEFEQFDLVIKLKKKKLAFELIDVSKFMKIKDLKEITESQFKKKYLEHFENLLNTLIDKLFENPVVQEKITNKIYFGQIKPDFSHPDICELGNDSSIIDE